DDGLLDDVHADAAARHLADGGGGREAGPEDQLERVAIVHGRELGVGDDALLPGLRAQLRGIHAAAVVGDADDDLVAAVGRAQADDPFGRLAGGLADVGRLDAVIDRVA